MTGSPQPPEPYSNEEIPRCAFGLEAGDAPTGREYDRLAASLRELSRLRDALRSSQRDSERLDWLESSKNYSVAWNRWSGVTGEFREAIDAARGVSSGDQPGGGSQ
jgi:hypothetical protein